MFFSQNLSSKISNLTKSLIYKLFASQEIFRIATILVNKKNVSYLCGIFAAGRLVCKLFVIKLIVFEHYQSFVGTEFSSKEIKLLCLWLKSTETGECVDADSTRVVEMGAPDKQIYTDMLPSQTSNQTFLYANNGS